MNAMTDPITTGDKYHGRGNGGCENLSIVPGTGDRETLLASFANVRRLKERLSGMEIAASHDFAAEAAVARATHRTS